MACWLDLLTWPEETHTRNLHCRRKIDRWSVILFFFYTAPLSYPVSVRKPQGAAKWPPLERRLTGKNLTFADLYIDMAFVKFSIATNPTASCTSVGWDANHRGVSLFHYRLTCKHGVMESFTLDCCSSLTIICALHQKKNQPLTMKFALLPLACSAQNQKWFLRSGIHAASGLVSRLEDASRRSLARFLAACHVSRE